MPTSMDFGKNTASKWLKKYVTQQNPTIVDVGVGAGAWGKLVKARFPQSLLIGIEVWNPYVAEFDLLSTYDYVIRDDIRRLAFIRSDVVIFGDVLEHMTQQEAIEQFTKAQETTEYIIISIPVRVWEQHGEDNPYEEHIHHWSHDEVLAKFGEPTNYVVGSDVGVYLYQTM